MSEPTRIELPYSIEGRVDLLHYEEIFFFNHNGTHHAIAYAKGGQETIVLVNAKGHKDTDRQVIVISGDKVEGEEKQSILDHAEHTE